MSFEFRPTTIYSDKSQSWLAVIADQLLGLWIAAGKKKQDATFNSLMELRKSPSPLPLSTRALWYLEDIFPLGFFRRRPLPEQRDTSDKGRLGNPICMTQHDVRNAEEMIKLKRFFSPEDNWPESELFKKEFRHATSVADSDAFGDEARRILGILTDKHFQRDMTFWAWDEREMDAHEEKYQDFDDPPACSESFDSHTAPGHIPQHEDTGYKLTALCNAHMVSGLSFCRQDDLVVVYVIPQLFAIVDLQAELLVRIPAYLEIDWTRQWPKDVIKTIQKRSDWDGDTRIRRIKKGSAWYPSRDNPEAIIGRYYELYNQLASMGEVYDNLNKEFRITDVRDNSERRRIVRRFLKNHGIPPSANDPALQGDNTTT